MKTISEVTKKKFEKIKATNEEIKTLTTINRNQRRYFWKLIDQGMNKKTAWEFTREEFKTK